MAEIKGIDVSAWQETIDWKKVAKDGVKITILRCTSGSSDLTAKDKYFEANYAGATANGIAVGVYRYSYAKTVADVKKEANGVVAALKGKKITYPVFFDLEWDWQQKNLTKAQLEEFINAFKVIIEGAGYTFGIYSNKYWIDSVLPASAKNYPLWLARYPASDNGTIKESLRISPSDYKNCVAWQYSSKGKVSGVPGNVDMDVFYTSEVKKETVKYERSKVVSIMQGWVGKSRSAGTHHDIIDCYNTIKPLPRGYKVTYKDAYCATTVSAAFHKAGYGAIFPSECGCGAMVDLAKKMGIWVENDAYVPSAGDCVLYDWDDNGKGDNTGYPDHVGMVEKVSGNTIVVIEGNMSGGIVGRRNLAVNGKYIRGFVCPKFTSAGTTTTTEPKEETAKTPTYTKSKTYTLQVDLNVRTGAGTSYAKKKKSQLTADGQKHANSDGSLKKGTVVTCLGTKTDGKNVWMKIPSGWCAAYYDGKTYIK